MSKRSEDNSTPDQALLGEVLPVAAQPVQVQPVEFTLFRPFEGIICLTCQEKILTDYDGLPFCPIKHPQCPRNAK